MSKWCLSNRIAFVDLSTRKVRIEATADYVDGFIGGRGLNQRLLLEFEPYNPSPFDPQTLMVFGAGRLVGTGAPGAVRLNIDSSNVFTGGIGSSNVGGRFATELKYSGFDHIVVAGKSEKPVFIFVRDGKLEIKDATGLWGKSVYETGNHLRSCIKDEKIRFLTVGPGGENRVWTSAIIEGTSRAAARCGLGAIMGDKKLKAIVARGLPKQRISTFDPQSFSRVAGKLYKKLSTLPSVTSKKRWGTVAAIAPLNNCSAMPVHNFADEYLSKEELSHYLPEKFDPFLVGTVKSCMPCPIKCQHRYKSLSPEELAPDKLEANTVWDFGPRLGLTKPEDLLRCHSMCTQLGLDMDSTSSAIAWAMDCFESGILTPSDTEGLLLQWGNAEVILTLLQKIARRQGIGELLSEGSLRAAQRIGKGSAKFSIHIKGQDLIEPMRSCKGWALGVAVSPRGGTHTRGAPQTEFRGVNPEMGERIWGVETAGNPREYSGKAKLVVYYERLHALLDSLGMCHFISNWSAPDLLGPGDLAQLCSFAFGETSSESELMKAGERIHTLEKIYNLIHTDFGRKADYPPERFMEDPIRSGPFKGEKLEKRLWDRMLDEYYEFHGWDTATGYIREDALNNLNLANYSKALERAGKLIR
jgi:aldehyde:ferredoxin oxidoreductase